MKVSLPVVFFCTSRKHLIRSITKFLVAKLQYHGVRGAPLNWFKNYLEDRTQFTEVNNLSQLILPTKKEVTQGSVLRLLLFLIYVNDLHSVVQYPGIYHFADTNLLYSSKPLKGINEKVNFELKNVVRWLRANKGSLNARKTDLIFFRSKRKQMKKHMKFTISGQKLRLLATQNTSSYYQIKT